jgi:hypothetical protein
MEIEGRTITVRPFVTNRWRREANMLRQMCVMKQSREQTLSDMEIVILVGVMLAVLSLSFT